MRVARAPGYVVRLARLFCELLATRDMSHVARRRRIKDEIA
jgi:hypothetical protein